MKHGSVIFTLLALTLIACPIACQRNRPNIIEVFQQQKKVQLYLFAAGFCIPCREELHELNEWHASYKHNRRVTPTVFLIAGNSGGKPVTQEDAERFKKEVGFTFPVVADRYARFYKTFYKDGTTVPATVITKESGEVIGAYTPGVLRVSVLEARLNELLK